jgi:aminoglycoside 2''-phosphotransferase
MRPAARRQVTEHFEAYFADAASYAFKPVLRHGDFGTSNILYEPSTLTVQGVLDFGMTCLGDPAIDFAGLATMGEAFYRRCSAFYPAMAHSRHRVDFYRGIFALYEALFGVEHDDEEAFRNGMEEFM